MKFILPFAALLAIPTLSHGAISLSGPSSDWTSLGAGFDFLADQQTGQADSDIVGSGSDPGFFTTFDDLGGSSSTDGLLAFRVRFDENGTQGSSIQFSTNLWIGIDANTDGIIDAFMAVVTQGGGADTIEIRDAGGGANNSPSSTSILNSADTVYTADVTNYNYRAVDFTTDGGTTNDLTPGGTDTDYYVSFLIDFMDLVDFLQTQGIDIDDTSAVQYILVTSTQTNSLNQDVGGIDGNDNTIDLDDPWEDLGGTSPPVTPAGEIVPEPSSGALLGAAALLVFMRRRKA